MGFFKTAFNEFGKKTGKALGNKMYGAYADDRRVGVNRGKLKGESDGLRITTEDNKRNIRSENDEIGYDQNQKLLEEILSIELNPNNKNSLIKSLTTLSAYVELGMNENSSDEYFKIAKSKFDIGIAMLQSVEPNNSMATYFLQKKNEWRKKKVKNIIWPIFFVIVCLVFLIIVYQFADKL
ncbi:hypothetical protein LJC69_05615 [Bacteroidales bacterium OttesenSCG-928-K22]|nr:hypothetical protein [Bacteroidales bacterium OttesenSCG-928-K22]